MLNKFVKHVVLRELYGNNGIEYTKEMFAKTLDGITDCVKSLPFVSSKREYKETYKHIAVVIMDFSERYKSYLNSKIIQCSEIEASWLVKLEREAGIELVIPGNLVRKLCFMPIASFSSYEDMVDSFVKAISSCIDLTLKTAYITKEPTKEISRRLTKKLESLNQRIESNMTTFNSAVFNMTDYFIFEGNDERVTLCSLLDGKTCDTCVFFSGRTYTKKAPVVPLHERCRCFYINNKLDPEIRTLSYTSWFKNQEESFIKEILGKQRYELLKRGVVMEKFSNTGVKIPFEELSYS